MGELAQRRKLLSPV